MASADPPEHDHRSGVLQGSDPPSSASVASGGGSFGGGRGRAGGNFPLSSFSSSRPREPSARASHHDYHDDLASVATLPSTGSVAAVAPASVLRNGAAGRAGGTNNDGFSSSSFGNRQHDIEPRNKRLAPTRRVSSADYSDDYRAGDDRYEDRSVLSSSSFGSRVSSVNGGASSTKIASVESESFSYSYYARSLITRGIDAVDAMLPPNKKHRQFTIAVSALVGLVGSMIVSSNPLNGALAPSGRTTSRALKDLAGNAEDGIMDAAPAVVPHSGGTGDFLDDFDQRRRRAADLPDGTVFSEPAHTRMCRTIVDRLDTYETGVTNFQQVIFTESEYVCRDPDAPYTAVLNMFAAQLLHTANNDIGLNVDYTHRCARWERYCTGNMTTIQFHLPDPLSVNAYAFQPGCVDAPSLRTICEGCLASDDPTNPDCVLFPKGYLDATTNTCNLGCYFSQVLPWIRNNLRTVATQWLNAVEARALTFWLRNAAEFSHREKDDMEVAVVSLSCSNDDCDMSMSECVCEFEPLPNWVYAMHVPRSSTNVAIVISPTCSRFGEGCTLHAQELFHFFKRLYPRADITENVITSTSSWYMRMITADHLVCPPGVGCLLPAIARDAYTYVYERTSPTVFTWLTCTPQDYLNRLTLPSFPPAFVEGDCRHLRARLGSWTPDAALAPSLQYNNPVDGYLGCADTNFVATAEDPYRPPTTFRWDESVWATCPVDVMTKAEICAQMDRLSLKRVLFVGDHTTMSQAISFASILGQGSDISLDPAVVPNFSKTVTCTPAHPNFDVTYIRNDRLEEPGTTPSPGEPNCGPDGDHYCYPWSGDYSSYDKRQLLVMNTGYHWGDDWEGYIANFQNFVGRIDEIAAANAARVSSTKQSSLSCRHEFSHWCDTPP